MSYTLVIVESPSKIAKISGYLGSGFHVRASFGHVRDLPKDGGLAVEFRDGLVLPQYVVTAEQRTIASLRAEAAAADRVILASDPDREGEGIAWHLRELLGPKHRYERVAFQAITPAAIAAAIAAPRPIDQHLVDAQQARRVLDRVVGWLVSPTCRKGTGDPAAKSAGRVQSVALRLVVERELEIRAFQPQITFTLKASLEKPGSAPSFSAQLVRWRGQDVEKGFTAIGEAEAVVASCRGGGWTVDTVAKTNQRRNPPPPFTTATLQQACSVQLGLRPEQTMSLAQQLYEAGRISYMRTDALNLSPEAVEMARSYIAGKFGTKQLPDKPNVFASKAAHAQEAHEAIRPTDVTGGPDILGDELLGKVYRLIWNRFIACQMTAGVDAVTAVEVHAAEGQAVLRARGVVVEVPGWRQLSEDATDEGAAAKKRRQSGDADDEDLVPDEDEGVLLPALSRGDRLKFLSLKPSKRTSKPPPRFTQASLIKKLDADGIGRPSTYATIMRTLLDRAYVIDKRRRLEATETGIKLVVFLKQAYAGNLIEYRFTANMEEQLDQVARGETAWAPLIHQASHQVLALAQAAGLDHNPLAGEQRSSSLPAILEIPRNTPVARCRSCAREIYWITNEGRNIPCNADGKPHQPTCHGDREGRARGQRGGRRAAPKEHSSEASAPSGSRPCRGCQVPIGFGKINGRLTALDADGTTHQCKHRVA